MYFVGGGSEGDEDASFVGTGSEVTGVGRGDSGAGDVGMMNDDAGVDATVVVAPPQPTSAMQPTQEATRTRTGRSRLDLRIVVTLP
jgi:hypothetical protein